MLFPRRFPLALVLTAAVGLGSVAPGEADTPRAAVAGAPLFAPAVPDPTPVEDPFPIARVRVAEDQLADALKQFDPGTLVRLPRAEFETRVRTAGRAVAQAHAVPRIAEATYTAALAGANLTGDAEWVVLNPRPRPAVLPLDPLKIAIRSPTWADGTEAVVGAFGPGFPAGPGVWTPTGRQVLTAKWSAAGTGAAGERQFDLRLPPCPAAVLDLHLPADRTPVVASADVLLTGPHPVPGTDKVRAWRFRVGDRGRLEFGVRGPGDAGPAPTLATLAAKYDLAPGQVTCAFEYDLRPTRGSVAEWAFTLSPGVQVTDAVANNRAGWRVDPATRELRVTLRQPGTGGKVLILAVAPLPPPGRTEPLPLIRPAAAVVTDERLDVRASPDLEVEYLDPADYRLTDSAPAADQGRVSTLVGSLLPPGAAAPFRRPPAVRVAGGGAEFTTDEGVAWRVEGGRQYVVARVGVRVRRGPLFRLALRTPPGFAPGPVTSTPEDVVSYSGPAAGPTPGVEVEFVRPLSVGQRVELRVELRGPPLPAGGPVTVPVPRLAPVGAAERDGWLSLSPGPGWALHARPSPGAAQSDDDDVREVIPPDAAAAYSYRGTEPAGELVLTPVHPAFTAATDTRLDLAGDRLTAATRITVKVTAGVLPAVTVFEPGPVRAGRTWRAADGSNAVTAVTPVPPGGLAGVALPSAAPWGGLARVAALGVGVTHEPGTHWVVRFARPVTGEVVLDTAAVIPAGTPEQARQLAADLAAGRRSVLTVRAAASRTGRVEPAAAVGGPDGDAPAAPAWAFDGLYHVTLCADAHALAVFGGSITARGGAVLPVGLPAGAEVRAACVGGHWLDPGRCEPTHAGDGPELRLPVPAGDRPVRFEVRYRLPTSGGVVRRVRSPAPTLPGEGPAVARWWAFPRGVAAAWPFAVRDRAAGELPALLGEPLDRRAGGLGLSRFAGEAVTVAPARLSDAVGVALAAVVAALGWVGARRGHRSLGFALLVVLIGAGLAYLLGPAAWEWAARPVVVVGLPAVAAVVVARGWRRPTVVAPAGIGSPADSGRRVAVAVAILACLGPLVALRAQPAAREVVFLLPGAEPGRETVLAPPAVLDRLDAAAKQPEPGPVITAAAYDGRADEGLARVTARFVVHSFRDGESTVGLPLADVRLGGVTVDGKPARPVAVRPDLYTVAVAGRGRHEVEARFTVGVTSAGPERALHFGVPEVPACRLAFAAPAPARQLQAVGRLGGQTTAGDKDAARLDADLGRVQAVQVRWRQGAGGAATVTARAGCVWDVAEAGHALTACYQVRVDAGSVSGFRFDLPGGLDPVRAAVRSLEAMGGTALVRDWAVGTEANGLRPLQINLTGPAGGRLLVVLECVPRGAPTRHPVLRFPRPVGIDLTGGIYGLRATGVGLDGVGRTGVIDFAADALVREFGAIPDLRLGPAVPVLAFSPRPGEAAELRPTLRPGPELPAVTQEVTWRVGPYRADGEGTIAWAAKGPVPVVEFALPAVAVTEVRGADVAGWAQADGRVQVWFRKPAREGSVEWLGTFAPSPPGKPTPEPLAAEPPVPAPAHVRVVKQSLRVHPADGWAGRVERDSGWAAAPADGRGWAFTAEGTPAPVRVLLFPPRGGAARGFGLAEVSGSAVAYRAAVEVAVPPGRPHHLILRVAGLARGATATPDLPPGTTARERPAGDGERAWDLDVAGSPAGTVRAAVVVRLPGAGTVRLPEVWCGVGGAVPEAGGVVRWVGVTGAKPGLHTEGMTPASPAESGAVRAAWPGEAERLGRAGGSAWVVTGGSPALVFDAPPVAVPTAPVAVPAPPAATVPLAPAPDTRLAALSAVGWCAAVVAVGGLFARLPRLTWPEQVGLLAGLFGFAVAGGWVVGAVAYGLARLGWVVEWAARPRPTRA